MTRAHRIRERNSPPVTTLRRLTIVLLASALAVAGIGTAQAGAAAAAQADPTAPAAVAPAAQTARTLPAGGRFTPVDTTRIWRGTVGTKPVRVEVPQLVGLPGLGNAAVLNVEVEHPTAAGWVRITPDGATAAVADQVFARDQTISALTTVGVVDGAVLVSIKSGTATVSLDLSGYYADTVGSTFTPVSAVRTFTGTVGTAPVRVPLAGRAGIPTDATAVAVNTGIGSPTTSGYVRVTPAGRDAQVATQEFTAGRPVSNLTIVRLVDGAAQVKVSAGRAQVFMDVAGYYTADDRGSAFVSVAPTRTATVHPTTTASLVPVTGTGPVPATASAVVATVGVSAPSAAGYVRVTAPGQDAQVAVQSFRAGEAVSNLVMTPVSGTDRTRNLQVKVSSGSATVFLDVAGYFVDGSTGSAVGVDYGQGACSSPANTVDTRRAPSDAAFGVVDVGSRTSAAYRSACVPPLLAAAQTAVGIAGEDRVQYVMHAGNHGDKYAARFPDVLPWPTSDTAPTGGPVVTGNRYGSCAGALDEACSYVLGVWAAWDATSVAGVPDPADQMWWLDVHNARWAVQDDPAFGQAYLEGATTYLESRGARVGIRGTADELWQHLGPVPATSVIADLPSAAVVAGDLTDAHRMCVTGAPLLGGPLEQVVYSGGGGSRVVSCR
ncbi:hypothetical protein GA0004736_2890 [Curtobacterium sp. 9128]|nr:hypothetical protein GA0004736_2890 [Curtobacterium sp. 9128]